VVPAVIGSALSAQPVTRFRSSPSLCDTGRNVIERFPSNVPVQHDPS